MTRSRGAGRSRCVIAALGALAAWAAAREARATGGGATERPRRLEATARAHHQRGESLYVAEQYPQALGEFEAGFAVLPLPGFLVNIGQCHRRMGDLPRARAAFERFLVLAPDSALAPEVRNLIREVVLTPPPLAPFAVVPTPAPPEAPPVAAPAPPVAVAVAAPMILDAPLPPTVVVPAPPPVAARLAPPGASQAAGAQVRAAPPAPVRRPRPLVTSWWLWAGVAVTAVVVSAIVISAGGGSPTTIHEGSLGTLRR